MRTRRIDEKGGTDLVVLRRRPRNLEVAEPAIRVNQRVRAPEVRLIGSDGAMIGIMSSSEAYQKALEAGLDLVEVNPKAVPPVCRLMDFGKFKYEQKKRASEAKKRQTVIDVKEIKFRPKTDEHDYDFKMRHIRRFLGEGNKVKVTVRFRGREVAHPQVAKKLLDRVVAEVAAEAAVEQESRMDGRTMFLLLGPRVAPSGPTKPAAPARSRADSAAAAPGPPSPGRRRREEEKADDALEGKDNDE